MENIEIIRIEHPESGRGIFTHRFSGWDYVKNFYERHENFPTPLDEPKLRLHFDFFYLCGYKSLEQMMEWVLVEEFETIVNLGFKFYLIKTNDYVVGDFQVIFQKEDIIEKIDITSLFKK